MDPGPHRNDSPPPSPSRRAVLCGGALVSLAAAGTTARAGARAGTAPSSRAGITPSPQPAEGAQAMSVFGFNTGWLFGGEYTDGSEDPGYDDSGFTPITLPHTVTPLSWGQWDPAAWEKVWIYRKHFAVPGLSPGDRVFADFDGVMTSATVVVNGRVVTAHQGGYLPWSTELTGGITGNRSVMAVIVDSRWLPVPPDGAPAGAGSVDYLQPGGIYRDVTLRVVPEVFLSDVFVKPVLGPGRSVEVQATIDAAIVPAGPVRVTAELRDATTVLGTGSAMVTVTGTGTTVTDLSITGIGGVTPWSPDLPKLYTVRATLEAPEGRPHTAEVRTGFRKAVFRADGFYLNGERRQIFGLNRHQLFPYTGMAAAARLQRRDAEILKLELNCNMVRCSHYPQSPHFLDACDELGLMVWQEAPGWQYVGGPAWQDLVVDNVRDMVVRDRSRPSVILWGTRLNETVDHPRLYTRTRQAAEDLDGTRQTTGAAFRHTAAGWDADVFGYDDYHCRDGNAELEPPLPGLPYLVSEAVGAMDGPPAYRWTDTGAVLADQGRMHAQVHNTAQADPRYTGLLGWAAIDYASLNGGIRIWETLKTPGVLDTFRVPKPGAAFYRSQRDPLAGPVILPVFFWDFGPGSPRHGPGPHAMIATNCDRLEIYAGGEHLATGTPDFERFGCLDYPPVFADLSVDGSGRPELHIDGYVGGRRAASVRMSADPSRDRLALAADDRSIQADGTDTTRVTFLAVDAYGNQRPRAAGDVRLSLTGPAVLIGDNPFSFGAYGGVGGAFVRSEPGRAGLVTVTAQHPDLGRAGVGVTVTPLGPGPRLL